MHGARDNFNNFHGFLVAAFDAIIVSQTVALAFEAHGIKTLAQFYTSELKYSPIAMREISKALHALIADQGFEQTG